MGVFRVMLAMPRYGIGKYLAMGPPTHNKLDFQFFFRVALQNYYRI